MTSIERFVVGLMVPRAGGANATRKVSTTPSGGPAAIDHSLWSSVLAECVGPPSSVAGISDTTLFDYRKAADDKSVASNLKAYVDLLGSLPRDTFDGLSDNERCALLINAYNALAVESILAWYTYAIVISKLWKIVAIMKAQLCMYQDEASRWGSSSEHQ